MLFWRAREGGALTYPLIAAPSHQPASPGRYKIQVHTHRQTDTILRGAPRIAGQLRYPVTSRYWVGGLALFGLGVVSWQVSLTIPSPWVLGPSSPSHLLTLTLTPRRLIVITLTSKPLSNERPHPSPAHPPVPHHDYPPKRRNCFLLPLRPHPLPSCQLLL